ncbi:hypothetical protein AZ037_000960 [Klebsiella michiganensis]|nr:hypothetical protein AZ037_000960 [Klebsiella michiganensis]
MSKKLLQLHFAFNGPFGSEMSRQLVELAESINQEPGFIWKVWTESEKNQEAAGSIFLRMKKPRSLISTSTPRV